MWALISGWQTPYFPLDLYIEEISKRGRDWMPLMVCLLSVHEALDHSLVPQIHFTAHIIPNSPLTHTLSLRARISACSFWEQTKFQSIEETFISPYSSLLLPDLNIIWIIHIRKRYQVLSGRDFHLIQKSSWMEPWTDVQSDETGFNDGRCCSWYISWAKNRLIDWRDDSLANSVHCSYKGHDLYPELPC